MKTYQINKNSEQLKSIVFCFVALLLTNCALETAIANTPTVNWIKQVSVFGEEFEPSGIEVDKDNNIIVCGRFSQVCPSSVTTVGVAGTFVPKDNDNFLLAKLTPAGNVLWLRTDRMGRLWTYKQSKMEIDHQGNIYVGGAANAANNSDSLVIDNISYTLASPYKYLIKYDSNGNVKYVKQFKQPSGRSDFNFAVGKSGHVTCISDLSKSDSLQINGQSISVTNPVPGADYGLLFRLDSLGNLDWYTEFGISGIRLVYNQNVFYGDLNPIMEMDNSGNVFVVIGGSDTVFTTATTLIQTSGSQDIDILVKFDNAGNLIAANTIGIYKPGAVNPYLNVNNMEINQRGEPVITGDASGVIIGQDTIEKPILSYQEIFISNFDTNLNNVWTKHSITNNGNSPSIKGFHATVDGYLLGNFNSRSSTSIVSGSYIQGYSLPSRDYILELDLNGNYRNVYYDTLIDHSFNHFATDTNGQTISLGMFRYDQILFGIPIQLSAGWCVSSGPGDGFIAKIKLTTDSLGAATDSVWPGDCNADGICNALDFFNIGLGYGYAGPVRPNATDQWIGQSCPDWGNTLSGLNAKHADADGNGLVDQNDATPILLNFGNVHSKTSGATKRVNDPDLYLVANYDTTGLNTLLTIDVHASTSMTDSLYGITFQITFDKSLVDTNSISFLYPSSWIGTVGTDLITFQHNQFVAGAVDVALTRINRQNKTGNGVIARMYVVTTDNLSGGIADLDFEIDNLWGVRANGDVMALTYRGDTVTLKTGYTSIGEHGLSSSIHIYPNPVKNEIFIYGTDIVPLEATILNSLGQIASQYNAITRSSIDVSHLNKGIYFIRLKTKEGDIVKKLVVE